MARGVNKVILIGNLGRDPELSYTPSGLAVARFSLATTDRRKNAEGEWEDNTEWHRVVLFGKTAEAAGQYLSKGRQVYIEGRLSTRSWEQEGVKRYTTDIIGSNMQMLGRREDAGRTAEAPPSEGEEGPLPPKSEPPGDDLEDDLPF